MLGESPQQRGQESMKIAVVGLYSIKNVGDNVLCSSTIHLIRERFPEAEIVRVDVNPPMKIKNVGRLRYYPAKLMQKLHKYLFGYENGTRFRYRYEYLMWWLKSNKLFRRKITGCDAVVFAGGGFLKFRTQGLNYYVEQIVKIARKQGIPVMMNGVGIEGYDENDIRCQKLKQIINDDCVRVITTRDDIDILQNHYIHNEKTLTARVGDPALWVPQVYSAARAEEPSSVVAVNPIRGKVYQDYGNELTSPMLMNFYRQLLIELDRRGIEWVMLSNGMKADDAFGKTVMRTLGVRPTKENFLRFKKASSYVDYVSKAGCVFGARLHACIISYSLDVPVVGLIWNDKTLFFSELIGKRHHFFTEKELDVAKIADAIEEAMHDHYDPEVRQRMKNETVRYLNTFLDGIEEN